MAARRIVLKFPHRLVDQPIISRLVRRYDLDFNILKAQVTPREEGLMVLALEGPEPALDEGVAYLEQTGIQVQLLANDIVRDEPRCTHCGACTAVCPTGALAVNRATMMVDFDNDKCVACEYCVTACPTRAMVVRY